MQVPAPATPPRSASGTSRLLVINLVGKSFSSMIMAGLWALALGCYVTGLFAVARRCLRNAAGFG
jgi:hypothetical protein